MLTSTHYSLLLTKSEDKVHLLEAQLKEQKRESERLLLLFRDADRIEEEARQNKSLTNKMNKIFGKR